MMTLDLPTIDLLVYSTDLDCFFDPAHCDDPSGDTESL